MKSSRTLQLLRWSVPVLSLACVPFADAQNPMAHVDIKVVKSYANQTPLPKPERVLVYDFTVAPGAVKTDPRPGVRQRVHNAGSSDDAATQAGKQVQDEITTELVKGLEKRLKSSGIVVEKATTDTQVSPNTLIVRGEISKLDEGKHIKREVVGFGRGASDVKTDCQISLQTPSETVLVSELTTNAQSSKKPGAAATMGAGAAPDVAAATTGATAHKSTAQGDSSRTGSALAKRVADIMKTQGWVQATPEADDQQTSAATTPKQ
jgi:Domain of unknown function (DUF4410)